MGRTNGDKRATRASEQTTIEAAIGVEITQLRDLPNKLFCFKLAAPRETSKYLRFFLGEFDSPDQLLVRQQNREALESNLASLARKLDAAVEGMHSHPLLGSVELSRRDVLFFNINHYCRPTLLYTNGRAAVSVVRRTQNRFEVVRHRSLSFFKTFVSDFGWTDCLIGPEEISIAHDFESAERLAREFLTRTLRMRKGASIEQVTLVPEEGSAVVDGYPVHVLVATFGTREFRLQFGGAPCGPREAFRVLNEFCPDGFVAEVCATCTHFRFSGMSRDMSAVPDIARRCAPETTGNLGADRPLSLFSTPVRRIICIQIERATHDGCDDWYPPRQFVHRIWRFGGAPGGLRATRRKVVPSGRRPSPYGMPTICPLVPVKITALLGSNSLILPR